MAQTKDISSPPLILNGVEMYGEGASLYRQSGPFSQGSEGGAKDSHEGDLQSRS